MLTTMFGEYTSLLALVTSFNYVSLAAVITFVRLVEYLNEALGHIMFAFWRTMKLSIIFGN